MDPGTTVTDGRFTLLLASSKYVGRVRSCKVTRKIEQSGDGLRDSEVEFRRMVPVQKQY